MRKGNTMNYSFFVGYLIAVNLISCAVCVADKYRAAKGKWRVKESTLFSLCFVGGGVGMYLTMRIIRHKTLHKRFMIGIPLIILAQVTLVVFFILKNNPNLQNFII